MLRPRLCLPRPVVLVAVGWGCLLALGACGRNRGIERTADRFLAYLVSEDYTAATKLCDERLSRNMTPERLKQSWARLQRVAGEYRRDTAIHTEVEGKARVVVITCEFEWRKMDLRATFDDKGRITHLVFVSEGKKPSPKSDKPEAAPPQPKEKKTDEAVA